MRFDRLVFLGLVLALTACGQAQTVAGAEPEELATTTTVPADELSTTTTVSADLAPGQGLEAWVTSVRFEPWYDGFRFEGAGGTLALNPEVAAPVLPEGFALRTVTSRMGQQRWDSRVFELTGEMNELDVLDLRYDPFADTLTISRAETADQREEAEVADQVRALLGNSFGDIDVAFESGFPIVDGDPRTNFESPPTTRG